MTFPVELVAALNAVIAYVVSLVFQFVFDKLGIDLSEAKSALVTAIAGVILAFLTGLLAHLDKALQPLIIELIVLAIAAFASYKNRQSLRATRALALKASKKK